jgi:hypothetical protein
MGLIQQYSLFTANPYNKQTLIAPRRNEKDILSNKRHHRTENLARFGGELSRTSRLLEAVTVAVLPKIWGELPHQAQEFPYRADRAFFCI